MANFFNSIKKAFDDKISSSNQNGRRIGDPKPSDANNDDNVKKLESSTEITTILYNEQLLCYICKNPFQKQHIDDHMLSCMEKTSVNDLDKILNVVSLTNTYDLFQLAIPIITQYLNNICNSDDPKFKKIRLKNKIFQEKIALMNGHEFLLNSIGFVKNNLNGEDFFIFDEQIQNELIVKNIKIIELFNEKPLDYFQDIKILKEINMIEKTKNDSQDDLVQITGADVKTYQQQLTKRLEYEQTFCSKNKRINVPKHHSTRIKIKLPDQISVYATFSVVQSLNELFKVLQEIFCDNNTNNYELFYVNDKSQLVEIQTNTTSTFKECKLYPRSAINLKYRTKNENSLKNIKKEYLFYIN